MPTQPPMSSSDAIAERLVREFNENPQGFAHEAMSQLGAQHPKLIPWIQRALNCANYAHVMVALCMLYRRLNTDSMQTDWPGGFLAGEAVTVEGYKAYVMPIPPGVSVPDKIPVAFMEHRVKIPGQVYWFSPEMVGTRKP